MKIKREIASILIIGNEILSGKTQDTNSNYIARKLYTVGVRCEEINVVADNHEMIILKINELRKKYDYVFTTGGIGPTHDDITAFAISKALNLPYVINPIAKKKLEDHYSDEEFTKARQKMAYMPKGAKLIDNPVSVAPGFNVKNIYVFPGVPKILEVMLDEFIKSIKKKNKFFKKTISTTLSEGIIGEYLSEIQIKYKELDIGSYPYFKKNSFGVSIIFTGDTQELVLKSSMEVYNYLRKIKGDPKLF